MVTKYNFRSLQINLLLTILTGMLVFSGCKKDNPEKVEKEVAVTPTDKAPTSGSRDQLTKDSIFLYARQVYLWYNALPDYQTFNPRQYGSFNDELYALTRFGINPATSKPFEFHAGTDGTDSFSPKYSYISDITKQNPTASIANTQSSVDLEGNGNDFGLLVSPYGSETAYSIHVKAVYAGSPAHKAGFKRGDRFNKINGRTIGSSYNNEYSFFFNALMNSSTVSIEGRTAENIPFNRSLNRAIYSSHPIYKDSVYTSGSKKIGYIAYARFSSLSNSQAEFNRVFNRFSQHGVTDLIVDLRYNGGGYVSTAERLINLIAPTSLNGKVMFVEYYNQLMQNKQASILANQPLTDGNGKPQYQQGKLVTYNDIDFSVKNNTNYFSKQGNLNTVKNVVFIVTGSTASASELVINSLKPHLNVKVVGSTSYGKPVGFFPIRIHKYEVYFSMFETRNSAGEGSYYAGFTPDTGVSTTDNDNPNYDFGDIREASFAAAYNYLTKGTYTSTTATTSSLKAQQEMVNSTGGTFDREFKGMIQLPHNLKLRK